MGLGLTFMAAFGTSYILRGLANVAKSAEDLMVEATNQFLPAVGRDEVGLISRSLVALYNDQRRMNGELVELNQSLDQTVADRTQEVQRLSNETKIAAITRERLRMSRDLHDTLAHSMLAVLTQIKLIRKLQRLRPDSVAEELGFAEKAAEEGLALARQAVGDLRYYAVRDDGLGQAVEKSIKRLKERMEINVLLSVDKIASTLASPPAETTYRVVEEALHNVERHSDATKVRVDIVLDSSDIDNKTLRATVSDDGRGFDSTATNEGHFGIIGMQEQAEIQGGRINIESSKNDGTKVIFEVKL